MKTNFLTAMFFGINLIGLAACGAGKISPSNNTAALSINPIQWDMQLNYQNNTYPTWTGDNFIGAWSLLTSIGITPGAGVRVAVIDTGYTPHLNFTSNLQALPDNPKLYGYQFITDCNKAGIQCPSDGSTIIPPQPNAIDLGDYCPSCEHPTLSSSWHGTHVTGTIIAQGYNGDSGILGGAYGAKVVPVRVLGKGGGSTEDVQNGMLWAGGLPASDGKGGHIINPNPAQVINLSLGGNRPCGKTEQDVINMLTKNGVIVVAAAGNNSQDVANHAPANCQNVISVSAKGPTNKLADYSNYGNTTITASGGDAEVSNPTSKIYSTIWVSPYSFDNNDGGGFKYGAGTSMAAPHVAAAIADIISYLKSINKSYDYTSIVQILKNSASTNYNKCNSKGCVTSGALDVEKAIRYIVDNKK